MTKTVRTVVELSADVRAMLDQIAKAEQRTMKGQLEWMIRRNHEEWNDDRHRRGAPRPVAEKE
jgi:predicted transcriptional regulator